MRVSVAVLLLAAISNAAELKSRSKEDVKTEKKALKTGENSGVEKRAILPTALPSPAPGIVYADAKEVLTDKSPVQQLYARPVPQIAKISDVLTGHGPSFPAAIASHLYSPISVYQPKLATPTTYEVSAPVPAQLAYAERISYPVQYTPQVLYSQQQPQFAKQINFPRYNAVQVQQAFHQQIQPQNPRLFTHPQTFQAQIPQVILNQQPQYQNPQYQQAQFQNPQYQNPQAIYAQVQQQLAERAQIVQPQPGIVYARQETEKESPKPIQRELKTKVEQSANQEKPKQSQNYNAQPQPQGAVSYASFSQGHPSPQTQQPQAQNQYQQPQSQSQVQPQFLIQVPEQQPAHQQAQIQYQAQPHQYQAQPHQYQPQAQTHYQIQIPHFQPQAIQFPQYQPQAQIQYQQPQIISKIETPVANSIAAPAKQAPARQVVYLRPQEYQYQPQVFQGPAQPAFPAVQYFGKFAQELFGGYQQNH